MNLLITGSSGFIGTNFIRLSQEYNIFEIDLLITNILEVEFNNIDSVLHLAALAHQKTNIPESQYLTVNRDLAFDFAKLAKKNGVKQFILMSTAKVYGDSTTGNEFWDEDSECSPTDDYGRSKHEAEKLVFGLNDEDFKVAIVRSPLVYGPGVKANMLNLLKLVDKMLLIPLGGIENRRSMVYTRNLIGLFKAILSERVSGIFIAGDRMPISTTRLIHFICQFIGKKRIIFRLPDIFRWIIKWIRPDLFDRLFESSVFNNENTNQRLNFTPPYSSEEGIHDMVEWYLRVKVLKLRRDENSN